MNCAKPAYTEPEAAEILTRRGSGEAYVCATCDRVHLAVENSRYDGDLILRATQKGGVIRHISVGVITDTK